MMGALLLRVGSGALRPILRAALTPAFPPRSRSAARAPGGMELPGPEGEKQASAEPRPGGRLPSWWCLVFFLCFYGFLAQMRPGESFITPYLLGPDKNFTQKQARGRRERAGREPRRPGGRPLRSPGATLRPLGPCHSGPVTARPAQQRAPCGSL